MKFLLSIVFVAAATCVSGLPSGYQQISVPDYHPQLQNLGQHVDLPQIPTKIIKITKTVAIKVPVPYPVKVPHRVPYPVQVNKPYPVVVPQIVKVPQPYPVPVHSGGHGQDAAGAGGHAYEGGSGFGAAAEQGDGGYSGHFAPSDSYEHAASQQVRDIHHFGDAGLNGHAQGTYQLVQAQAAPSAGDYSHQQSYQEVSQPHYQQEQASYGH